MQYKPGLLDKTSLRIAPVDGSCVVSACGHTLLPKSVRHHLNLGPGSMLGFRVHDPSITLYALNPNDAQYVSLLPFLALLDADLAIQADLIPDLGTLPEPIVQIGSAYIDPQRPIIGPVSL